ncbi:WASH complex subunit 2-like [Phlebotomus argentipes]|uniref:WASH complex subunit 2-like n=1 Tax=Phlebotomus argentipes TaxID=94469 RepID=UPI002892D2BA|nr:WASH complex subunit 2-like [Phlebotomus argentipes]
MNPSSARAQEIRREATKWSLDGDAKLLEYMREISQNLESRCRETELSINRMCLSADQVNVELGNTTNRLLALQHSQFVENRVQEDDEASGTAQNGTDKAPETRQMSPMSTLKSVLADSVACLNDCYEKIQVELDEDSEEEDEPGRSVAFRPKDPYAHRPLPYVIGSKEFKEKWHVGLVDSESDQEHEEDPQFSDSGSESGHSVSLPSVGGSEADSVWGLQATSNALAHKSASQISSEDENSPKVFDPPVPAQRAYFQPPKLTPRTSVPENPVTNLFSSSPPRIPGTSKATGLFDDLEDYDFDAPAPKADSKPPPFFRDMPETHKTVNLFDDEPPEFEAPPLVTQKSRQSRSFLESDNEEEVDLPKKIVKEPKVATNLFNEEPPVDDFQEKNKLPANLFEDNDDEFDSFMSSLKKPSEKVTKPKLSNLFDDDDEPEDFLDTLLKGVKTKPKSQPVEKKESKLQEVKEDLNDAKEKREIAKEPRKVETVKKISLFDDSDDEDIFSETGKKTEPSINVQRNNSESLRKESLGRETPQETMSKERTLHVKEPSLNVQKKNSESLRKESRDKETPHEIISKETTPLTDEPSVNAQSKSSESLRKGSLDKETSRKERKPLIVEEEPPLEVETPPVEEPPVDQKIEESSKKPEEAETIPENLFPDEEEPEDWLEASPNFHKHPPSNLFSEPPEDVSPEKKESKLPGLFDDLDDDDDDFFTPKRTEEQQKTTNMPLFDDLPPDDDLFANRSDRKEKEVFYDDFADSFPPEVSSVNPSGSSYLFNDEPPPVDDWQESGASKDEPDEIIPSVRNLINRHEKPENVAEEPLNKPKIVPNKLSKTMAINVAALLPGAKRPSFKNVQESPTEEAPVKSPEEVQEVPEVAEKIEEKPEDPSLLVNLNRNRAKIPQKRKPSTRRGRQETYRKSLILESDNQKEGIVQNPEREKKLPEDLFGDDLPETEKKAAKVIQKVVKSAPKSLFESDDEDSSDIFSMVKPKSLPKSTSEPTKITPKPTSLFGDSDEDDDDLFGAANKSNAVKITAPVSKVEKKITKKSAAGDDPLADLF